MITSVFTSSRKNFQTLDQFILAVEVLFKPVIPVVHANEVRIKDAAGNVLENVKLEIETLADGSVVYSVVLDK